MSQRERILDWLRRRGREGVHSFELYSERMPRAAAVIHQLRKDGYVIESVQGVFRGDAKGVWYFLRGEPKGQVERAGVGGGTTTSSSDYSAAPHPGSARLDSAPLPRPGGGSGGSHSRHGTVTAAAPDELQLDLGDTPTRPGHFDDWDVAA